MTMAEASSATLIWYHSGIAGAAISGTMSRIERSSCAIAQAEPVEGSFSPGKLPLTI
jgi:hypothetical protein